MVRIALQNFVQQSLGERLVLMERTAPSFDKDLGYCGCEADLRVYGFPIYCERLFESLPGLLPGRYSRWPVPPCPSPHYEIARVGICLGLLLDTVDCRHHEFAIEGVCQASDNVVLRLIQVYAAGVKAIRPEMCAVFGIDQLHVHPDLISSSADTAFKDLANPKLAAYLPCAYGFAFVCECSISRDYESVRNPRQVGRQILGYRFGEIVLLRIFR
jgi:hypothetical protein